MNRAMFICACAAATTVAAQDSVPATPCKLLSHSHRSTVAVAYRYQPFAPLDPAWAHAIYDSITGQWPAPRFKHERTDITFTIKRDSAVKTYRVLRASGDKDFDKTAARALALAAVGHKLIPLPPTYAADSVVFVMMFGDLAAYMDSVYASSDRQLAQPWSTNDMPRWPPGWRITSGNAPVTAEFDIDSTGRVVVSTIRITDAPNADFAAAVREVIPRWRFTPAVDHCHPVRSSYHFTETYHP